MAIKKERKEELVSEYGEWVNQSRILILAEYAGLTMKQLDELRLKLREVGGEFHIIKNTLGKLAVKSAGLPLPAGFFEGSTAIGFTYGDAPAMAKALTEFARASESLKLKGGYLGRNPVTAEQIKNLADLPPLPVIRAQLMGTLLSPASQLARTLAEPARQLAALLKAYAETGTAAETT